MENRIIDKDIVGITALMVHAARIDENYSSDEKKIILNFINLHIKKGDNAENVLSKAENVETNSTQLLNYTKIIKENSLEFKSLIVKELWKIIISDNQADQYESNLIRRICGLIYFPDKLSGEIKLRVINEIKK
tara:strand:- start:1109 stop:1510 length:402 start_codon:yes stop_codon:yes gene_type:complete